jgi:hypothetical protein
MGNEAREERVKIDSISAHAPEWYTLASGGFLLLQGISTLLFRLVPALDAAFPALLATTHMMPAHSALHIITGVLALAVVRWGGTRGMWWFALGLQPFDHPFHLVAGLPGLLAAAFGYRYTS